ncbi:MAG: ATP-binding protein [Syntrophobacteraceae bacterium]
MFLRFSIAKKFVFAFLLISVIPLGVLGFWTLGSIREIGQRAITSTTHQLESRARESLELRAIELAKRVSQSLQSGEADLLTLKMLPRNPQVYRRFSLNHRRDIWTRELVDGKLLEVHKEIPLYSEISFIGPDGVERVRIMGDEIQGPSKLRDVSKPENTTYKSERYFGEALKLKSGEIWVSHVTGWYTPQRQQPKQNAADAADGSRYDGVVRFATPCIGEDGRFEGMVLLSLDHRHLMELTLHILPTEERFAVYPDYASGNYAFMFDDQGWIISHPKRSDIRGVLPDGSGFDAGGKAYTRDLLLAGQVPFNLDRVSFINPNYPLIAREVRAGHSGVTETFNVGGTQRIMAYAPIFYGRPPYDLYGIFGGITLGVETAKFEEPALHTGARIDEMVDQTKRNGFIILVGAALVAVILAVTFSRTLTRPILYLAGKAREIAAGRIPRDVAVRTGDELEVLAANFSDMAREIHEHRENLEQSLAELAQSKRDVEQHTRQVEKQFRVLNNVYYLSQYLSTVYDGDQVLETVLKTSVEGLGFDRAILYLYDERYRRLVCHKTFGFSPEDRLRAMAASYDVDRHDCIPTKVFNSSETIFVKDIHSEEQATSLDLKISEVGQTYFFVFTPIKSQGRIIGVLGADTKINRHEIKDIDVESLEILANDAARALERSELYGSLLSERNFIESIVTNISNGIITLDESRKITWFNPYSEAVFNMKRDDALGKDYREVFAGLPSWVDALEQYLAAKNGPNSIEHRSVFHDGKEKVLEVHFSTIRQERQAENVCLIIVSDVTERKLMEEHLRRSDRLISLGVLAAGIAHEIRNPLTGISLLMDDLHDHLHALPRERELIQKSLQEIDRLENLINGLLDFAVPSKQIKLELRPLADVLQNTLFLVKKLCKNNNISLLVNSQDCLPMVRLDPEKLLQAFLNLLMNAIQAMPQGGDLRVEVNKVSAGESLLSSPAVRISVQDTGKGISSEDIPYVFDPFFTRNTSGCGLGLAIVHSIVREHGGQISVSSQLGQGATFWVDLPIAQADDTISPNGTGVADSSFILA